MDRCHILVLPKEISKHILERQRVCFGCIRFCLSTKEQNK